jgi:hypothetical protein
MTLGNVRAKGDALGREEGEMVRVAAANGLRIGRGLFRLWLVSSVLWVGAVVAVVWQHEYPFDWVVVADCPFDPNPPPKGYVVDESKCITRVVFFEELFVVIRNSAPTALIQPVLVLVIGLALGWAFKGFRT